MSNIKFKIAAKTDVGRVRNNNEDNLQAASDLTTAPMKWVNDMECDLGDKGALLVVADGMGGMNAGEVASEIAINTIREFFSPDKITPQVLESKVGIESFMKRSIMEADANIKKAAHENPEHKGMGTTIVIAWLLDGKLYVAWCGDSRAYLFNTKNGLRQISKDHSYVQTLVDKGQITREDAFDYPDSNIITRCLCDSSQKARPDIIANPIDVCNGDIILLCTDGLSGMIRDHEIELILAESSDDLSVCSDKLIEAACEASGDDNITVALCKIISGSSDPKKIVRKNKLSNTISFSKRKGFRIKKGFLLKSVAFLLLIGFVYLGGLIQGKQLMTPKDDVSEDTTLISNVDKLQHVNDLQKHTNDSLNKVVLELNNTLWELSSKINRLEGDTARLNKEIISLRILLKQRTTETNTTEKKESTNSGIAESTSNNEKKKTP